MAKNLEAEKRAASKIVKAALAAGYVISVNDGGEWVVKKSSGYKEIMASLMSTDSDLLKIRKGEEVIGNIWFVWGNSAEEVVCDHSDNPIIGALVEGRAFVA